MLVNLLHKKITSKLSGLKQQLYFKLFIIYCSCVCKYTGGPLTTDLGWAQVGQFCSMCFSTSSCDQCAA